MSRLPAVRVVLLCSLWLTAAACDEAPQPLQGPSSELDAEFTLAPGESMRITDTPLVARFNGVTGDSRCPADAVCIQGGSASVGITVRSDGSTRDYELRTGDMQPVQHDGFTISLVDLQPYPFSSRTTAPQDYRATLKVTR
jgi:hypothetical protein